MRCAPLVSAVPAFRTGRNGHDSLDYEKLLAVGVKGLLSEINERRSSLNLEEPLAVAKYEFYEGCQIELEALLDIQKRYAAYARVLARSSDPERAAELEEIADILQKVPAEPAASFREALQAIHFYSLCIFGADPYNYGRLDQYLINLYREDIKTGRLSPGEAQELVDCFNIASQKFALLDIPQTIAVGGRDKKGKIVDNELTRIFLQSIANVHSQSNQIMLLYSSAHDREILRFAVELQAEGHSQPPIYNDDLISKSLRKIGVSEEDSYHYSTAGCVEIVPCACSSIYTTCPYHNLAKYLLEAMEQPVSSLEELITVFNGIVKKEVFNGNLRYKRMQMERMRNGGEPLRYSCLKNDCLARGLSVDEGGARYNRVSPNFIGFANVIDSLTAIDHLVFKNRELTMEKFREILNANYEGNEELRKRIIYKIPHFGTNEESTDALAVRITNTLLEICRGFTDYRDNAPLLPGIFTWRSHSDMGRKTGATPDGRKAGEAFAAGSSAVPGRETEGPTAALLSATAWDQSSFLGGAVNNITFSKKQLNGESESKERLCGLIEAFFSNGGIQIQFNITDRETLLDAVKHPEAHRDLVVRISGFNAAFVTTDPEIQQEIIARTEHIV
jgi:formate C-acetyltransferase